MKLLLQCTRSEVAPREGTPPTGDSRPGLLIRRHRLLKFSLAAFALSPLGLAMADSTVPTPKEETTVIIVVGAPGEKEYGANFEKWAASWEKACQMGGASQVTIGLEQKPDLTDRERLKQALLRESEKTLGDLWLVLIGHGTFDGKEAKFNLVGPDFSATELAAWLQPVHRPLAVINSASASGPFINKLSARDRVLVTSTRSGHEENYSRFGQYLAEAIADPQADLDKDGQTSLLEAFLTASHRVAEFYESEGRLATEHSLLDDNGDGLGTPADWFSGTHAVKRPAQGASPDGVRAHQFHLVRSAQELKIPPIIRNQRDELELGIAKLRELKDKLPEEEYYARLEKLVLDLAHLYKEANLLENANPAH